MPWATGRLRPPLNDEGKPGMRRRIKFCATGMACAGALVMAPAASADSVNIGSTLSHPATPALCNGCIGVQHGASGGLSPLGFTSPADGIVTSWSVRTADTNVTYALRILRKVATTSYLSAGR